MIVVEILGADGAAVSRVRLVGPFVIGTDPACGLILADRSVQPRQVEVRESADGAVSLRRLSDAGDTRVGALVLGAEAEATLPATLHVGEVTIRLASGGTPVPAAAPSPEPEPAVRGPFRPANAWGLALAVALLFAGMELFTTYEAHPWRRAIGTLLAAVVFLVIWAGAWAIGNRIFGQRKRFHRHLATVALWGLVAIPVGLTLAGARELLYADALGTLAGVVNAGLFAGLLYLHLRVSGRRRARTDAVVAAALVLAVGGLALLPSDAEPEKPVREALSSLAPLPAGLFVARPGDVFETRAARILEDLEGMDADRSVVQATERP